MSVRMNAVNFRILALFVCLSMAVTVSAQRTPREVAEWLGVGWNLGNQMDALQRGVSNETCWGNGSRSAGRECSGLLDHATGQWHNDGKQVMQTMVKGF